MVYLKISDKIGNQQFFVPRRITLKSVFFLVNETQSSLLKVFRNFKTFCVKEKFIPI